MKSDWWSGYVREWQHLRMADLDRDWNRDGRWRPGMGFETRARPAGVLARGIGSACTGIGCRTEFQGAVGATEGSCTACVGLHRSARSNRSYDRKHAGRPGGFSLTLDTVRTDHFLVPNPGVEWKLENLGEYKVGECVSSLERCHVVDGVYEKKIGASLVDVPYAVHSHKVEGAFGGVPWGPGPSVESPGGHWQGPGCG